MKPNLFHPASGPIAIVLRMIAGGIPAPARSEEIS
jgi:hypothetical protein